MMFQIFLVGVIFFSSCRGPTGPREVFDRYIDLRFAQNSTKEDYLQVTGGPLRRQIEEMDEKTFQNFASSTEGVSKRKIKLIHSTCQSDKCHFTYVIGLTYSKNNKKYMSGDIKKVVLLQDSPEGWKLIDLVSEPKTFFKGLDPITPNDFNWPSQEGGGKN